MATKITVSIEELRVFANSIHWIFNGTYEATFRPGLKQRQVEVLTRLLDDLQRQFQFFRFDDFNSVVIEIGEPYSTKPGRVRLPLETFRWMCMAIGSFCGEFHFRHWEIEAITCLPGPKAVELWTRLREMKNAATVDPSPDILPDWDG